MITRIFSVILAGLILVLTAPILILFIVLIQIKSFGPILFLQVREGINGKPFMIWKLRTMVTNSEFVLNDLLEKDHATKEEWEEYACLKNDPRIAGFFGKMARKLSIDELPQLINIIWGDMNFVGPRPLELYLAHSLPLSIRKIRSSIKPGLTGLWQIGKRSDVTISQMQRYDLLYIKKQCFRLDLYIFLKTIKVVFLKTGI